MDEFGRPNPLREAFYEALHGALAKKGLSDEQVESYLTDLLVGFLHQDRVYAIRNEYGQPIRSVAEMLAEGDVRLRAASFEREREVHRHVGNVLLFWSGLFPGQLRHDLLAGVVNIEEQGRTSYWIAGSFDHPPFDAEAPVLRKLSEEFSGYKEGLSDLRGFLDAA